MRTFEPPIALLDPAIAQQGQFDDFPSSIHAASSSSIDTEAENTSYADTSSAFLDGSLCQQVRTLDSIFIDRPGSIVCTPLTLLYLYATPSERA